MATHSGTLAWKIPWTEEPGGLQSVGLQRVRHEGVTSLSVFTFFGRTVEGRLYNRSPLKIYPGEMTCALIFVFKIFF